MGFVEPIISLREITQETVIPICKLSETLSEQHKNMVAPNSVSLAQALFSPEAWYRAVYLDETPIGFMMTATEEEDGEIEVFLWRFMIATDYQGKGYGKKALAILLDSLRNHGHCELITSCGQGEGSPQGFYEQLGFVATGEMDDDEAILVLKF